MRHSRHEISAPLLQLNAFNYCVILLSGLRLILVQDIKRCAFQRPSRAQLHNASPSDPFLLHKDRRTVVQKDGRVYSFVSSLMPIFSCSRRKIFSPIHSYGRVEPWTNPVYCRLMASSTTVTPFTPAYFEVTPAAALSSTITPFTRASFEDTPVTDVFNLANFQNLDVLTSTDPEEMEMFIDVHFDGKRFISFDLEYQGSFDFIRNVDGQDLRLTTMDIVSLQFAVDGRALVVPIHGNSTCILIVLPNVNLTLCVLRNTPTHTRSFDERRVLEVWRRHSRRCCNASEILQSEHKIVRGALVHCESNRQNWLGRARQDRSFSQPCIFGHTRECISETAGGQTGLGKTETRKVDCIRRRDL